ncbi:MAG: HEPN domain-containing protein [bacterium]
MKDKIVKEWFVRGEHDLSTAKLIFEHSGYHDEIIFLLQQALEKCVKVKNGKVK